MTRCINLRDWESRRLLSLAAGETAVLVRPVDARVPYVWEDRRGMPWPYDPTWSHGDDGDPWMPCPFGRPGVTLIGREAWSHHADDTDSLRDALDDIMGDSRGLGPFYRVGHEHADLWTWLSAATMPAWAARHRMTLVSVEVERCVDVSEDEWRAAGHPVQGLLKGRVNGAAATIHVFDAATSARAVWDEKRFPWAISHAWLLTVRKP